MSSTHLIVGPTATGKTALSVGLALRLQAPVVVLDRLQAHLELAVGSGRPFDAELCGTERIYLAERRVVDGELQADEAYELLLGHLERLQRSHAQLILEGGSLSLLRMIGERPELRGYPMLLHGTTFTDEHLYLARIRSRVGKMLRRSAQEPSMVSELASAWKDPRSRALMESVCGYDAMIAWCHDRGIEPAQIEQYCADPGVMVELGERVSFAHLTYGKQQRAELRDIVPKLKALSVHA